MWMQIANCHKMLSYLAFFVIGESVLTFIPFITGIAQEAIGCTPHKHHDHRICRVLPLVPTDLAHKFSPMDGNVLLLGSK